MVKRQYHETEIRPVVDEISVSVYRVRFREILGDEFYDPS
jgi:hypothetical protein